MTTNTHPSQSAQILTLLRERSGQWVPMPDLCARANAFAVHSRVAELRRGGHQIECEVRQGERHQKRSFYRMVGEVAR